MATGERPLGTTRAVAGTGRQRVLDAAYELFSRDGIQAVGVDTIISHAGVAKATLYRNFGSKDDLAVAFLEEREARWTDAWLRAEVERRTDDPAERLLAIFDVFGEWFAGDEFDGCAFVNVVLEFDDRDSPPRAASVRHLENIRAFLRELAGAAGIEDSDGFARQWHILMKGSIVSAAEGDVRAGARAKEIGTLLLARHGALPDA